jgi:hypothetical protein
MSNFELTTIIIGIGALLISSGALIFNGVQTFQANRGLSANQQLERGTAVLHFTSRFFDLVKDGDPEIQLLKPEWAYEYWSLHTTEFYFFHHGILPIFMYTLWMMDLANYYCGEHGDLYRKSHIEFLHTYSFHYKEMGDFYEDIYKIAKTSSDDSSRNRKITEFVSQWIIKNRILELS